MKQIFEPVKISHIEFKNRLVRSADTVMIAITGIHGNFYSNPFYYNIGNTLSSGNIDFIYVQTNDAFGQIETVNVNTGKKKPSDHGMSASLIPMRILMHTLPLKKKAMNTSYLPATPSEPIR